MVFAYGFELVFLFGRLIRSYAFEFDIDLPELILAFHILD